MSIDLVSTAKMAGIIGAGGAGFPTHVKLDTKAEIVIINGAECEPLLRVDQQLMAAKASELLKALAMMVDYVGADKGVVALKGHYHAAAAALNHAIAAYPKLSVHELGSFYPAGDEQVIVTEVTGRIVPEGGIPIQVGVVVSNVETALNLYDAVTKGVPVTEKYLTVTGQVRNPKTVKVPLGITAAQAIALAGGSLVRDYCVINGGPMMGKLVKASSLVTKTTKGLIILERHHPLILSLQKPLSRSTKDAAIACMQCSMCTEVCPRANLGHRIFPHKLMRMAAYGSMCDPKDTPMNAALCCGCRLCEYACVMNIQPWKLNTGFKDILAKNGIRSTLKNAPDAPHPFRETKRYPASKLIKQLGLDEYDVAAPYEDIEPAFNSVALSFRQGVGAPAEPVINQGDKVTKGMLVAQIPEGKLGSNLHASINGTVTDITSDAIIITA